MEKIHSLTGMMDLIAKKTSKDEIADKVFYTEEVLEKFLKIIQFQN